MAFFSKNPAARQYRHRHRIVCLPRTKQYEWAKTTVELASLYQVFHSK